RRHGRALHPRPERRREPVPLRARHRAGELVPRGRGLRARGLPLAPDAVRATLPNRRPERRSLGRPPLPDPVAGNGRARRLANRASTTNAAAAIAIAASAESVRFIDLLTSWLTPSAVRIPPSTARLAYRAALARPRAARSASPQLRAP